MPRPRLRIDLLIFLIVSIVATATPGAAAEPVVLPSQLKPEEVGRRPYSDYARECIDVLIEKGTDRYGKVHGPMLMNILDVRTQACPADPLPLEEQYRVSRRGRRGPGGGNLYLDQPTLRAMAMLSEMTGEDKYREFAARTANWTMTELVDAKGLFWWGYHRHYDAHRDIRASNTGNHHEIHIQQCVWPLLWETNAEAVAREIEAIWEWHVINKDTGEINRHGDKRPGCDFVMSGGEILYAFAFMHAKTGEQKWLDRAMRVADYYWERRHPETNLLVDQPRYFEAHTGRGGVASTLPGLHCRSLLAAYQLTKHQPLLDYAMTYLRAWAKYAYDADSGRFWGWLSPEGTPVKGPRATSGYQKTFAAGHLDLWEPYIAGYQYPIYAAATYVTAYEMTGEKPMLETAKRFATWIEQEWPPRSAMTETWYAEYSTKFAPHGTYAGKYGRTILLMLDLHRATGEAHYRQFAEQAADEAVAKLYFDGLLRGHPAKPYYEAADGVGYLLQALVRLSEQ